MEATGSLLGESDCRSCQDRISLSPHHGDLGLPECGGLVWRSNLRAQLTTRPTPDLTFLAFITLALIHDTLKSVNTP